MTPKTPTQARIKELLHYNESTGDLMWKNRMSPRVPAGAIAGCITKDGYRSTKIDQYWIYTHRVIWIYVYGSLPPEYIDHIDGDRLNNKLSNLRAVTNEQNQHNQRPTGRKSESGILGVTINRKENRWQSSIRASGVLCYLGLFETIEEAQKAYKQAKKLLHPTAPARQLEGV